jgi:hypothetical protein
MCQPKPPESGMKIVRAVKSQGVILCTAVLNILVFSSMVGYWDRHIHCEGGMSPCFEDGKLF